MGHCPRPERALNASPESHPDDVDRFLVARVLERQDTAAFGELVSRHQSRVRVYLLRLTRNAALADDLAQDTFLHAWDRLAGYRGSGTFIGWLLRVAWTQFLQARRRSDRYRSALERVSDSDLGDATVMPDEVSADLDRLLAVLGEDEQKIMILSYACGLSHREISDASGLPVGTVKSIIHRAKLKIRNDFEITDHQYA